MGKVAVARTIIGAELLLAAAVIVGGLVFWANVHWASFVVIGGLAGGLILLTLLISGWMWARKTIKQVQKDEIAHQFNMRRGQA